MKFKIPNELLVKAGQHAAERGMTLEQYIQEAIGMLTDEQIKEVLEKLYFDIYGELITGDLKNTILETANQLINSQSFLSEKVLKIYNILF